MQGRAGMVLWSGLWLLALLSLPNAKARDDDPFDAILDWVTQFSQMPPAQQSLVLTAAGFTLQAKTGMDCNIFGGTAACKALAPESSYIQQCKMQAEPKVDCVLHSEVTRNLFDSPVDDLQDYLATTLGPGVKDFCPQCFERVQAMWCALAAPACGTFKIWVEQGILPVLSQAVRTYRYDPYSNRASAVSTVMPKAFDIAGLGLPCREMCDAMSDTCSCGSPQNDTLGSLITWIAAQPQLKGASNPATQVYVRTLFEGVWDRPFCSLFPTRASQPPGGRCTVPPPAPCAARTQWCDATHPQRSEMYKYVQSLLLLQLLRATTGWFTNDNAIIWGIHNSVNDAMGSSSSNAAGGDMGYDSGSGTGQMSGGRIFAIVLLCVLGTALLSFGAVSAVRWWKARQQEDNYFQLSEKENFVGLPSEDEGSERAGLLQSEGRV